MYTNQEIEAYVQRAYGNSGAEKMYEVSRILIDFRLEMKCRPKEGPPQSDHQELISEHTARITQLEAYLNWQALHQSLTFGMWNPAKAAESALALRPFPKCEKEI